MRFMVIVKATKNSEAGVRPKRATAHGDGQIQRGTDQGRRDAGARGASSKLERHAGQVFWGTANGDRWAIRRDERTRRRVLAVEVRIAPGGDRVGETLSQSDAGRGGGAGNPPGVRGRDFGAEFTPERREQEERLRV